jgi:tetratricopeptide (TPR) repeat protein
MAQAEIDKVAAQPGAEIARIVAEVDAAFGASDFPRAFQLADFAIERGMEHPTLFNARARGFDGQGRHREALADYERLRGYFPRHPGANMLVGSCHLKLERWADALAAFDTALAISPNLPLAHERRAMALGMLGEVGQAHQAYLRAVELKPDLADALGSLALSSLQARDVAAAAAYAQRALAADSQNAIGTVTLAMLDIAAGDISAAESKLLAVCGHRLLGRDPRVNYAVSSLAEVLDKKDCVEAAFAGHTALNRSRRALNAPRFAEFRASERVARLSAYFEECAIWPKRDEVLADSYGAAGHAFLLGFMRSGTTLLEAVLAGSPEIVALDERDCLYRSAQAFFGSEDGLDRLAGLSTEGAAVWRQGYWDAVNRHGLDVRGKVFMDKMPLHTLRLPLIARIFPEAKIVFALRDPRDVVLSCFRHRFDVSPETFEFLDLEDCAHYYASVMHLAKLYREKLPLRLLFHRYEDMVDDFDPSVQAVCEFIGVEWRRSMRDFAGGADIINEGSVSAAQVKRGLYKGAAGQWRRYRKQLEPILPILQPWVEEYDYPAE